MIPGSALAGQGLEDAFLEEGNRRGTPLIDYEMGGAGLNDPASGLQVRLWSLRYAAGQALISADGVPEVVLFSRPGIVEISLAFDQAMNPFVAFTDGGGTAYWWFDPTMNSQVFSAYLPAGTVNARCTLDDKRPLAGGTSDIILAYMRAGNLYYRQQRDRYQTEYLLAAAVGLQLVNVGMNRGNRLQFQFYPSG